MSLSAEACSALCKYFAELHAQSQGTGRHRLVTQAPILQIAAPAARTKSVNGLAETHQCLISLEAEKVKTKMPVLVRTLFAVQKAAPRYSRRLSLVLEGRRGKIQLVLLFLPEECSSHHEGVIL